MWIQCWATTDPVQLHLGQVRPDPCSSSRATTDPVQFHLGLDPWLDPCPVQLDPCSSSQRPVPAPAFKIRFGLGFPFFIQHITLHYIVLYCIMISMYVTLRYTVCHCIVLDFTSKICRKNFKVGSVEKLDGISLIHATYYIVLHRTILNYDISVYYTVKALLHCTTLYFKELL